MFGNSILDILDCDFEAHLGLLKLIAIVYVKYHKSLTYFYVALKAERLFSLDAIHLQYDMPFSLIALNSMPKYIMPIYT